MEFGWSEEQVRLKGEIVRFAQNELNDDLVQRDVDSEFPPDAWKKCAAFGIQGLPMPIEYGGSGTDALTVMLAMEALGYGCRDNGLIFSLNAQMWSCQMPILRSGTDEQKRRYLPGLCDGSLIGVQCMTESGSGSDAFALRTTASKTDEGYLLNGTKTFITNAPIADVFVVFAATDVAMGFAGISAFLVDRHASGVSVGRPFRKMGLRTSPMSEVAFENCEVPQTARLGPAGAGAAIFNSSMDWERSCILASTVGAMERQVERCVAYARERRQFGQAIGGFQGVSHKIVDMKIRLETSRLLLYRLGWQKRAGKSVPMESAMTKVYLSECFVQSSMDALHIHGGYGYLTELELEREVRDAIASRIYSGTSEVQRNLVASHLGLKG
ncbi:MAG: acyl-CoA dehydrogenase family protein [Actinomycetota bacterium]